jgi:hypothetical protein
VIAKARSARRLRDVSSFDRGPADRSATAEMSASARLESTDRNMILVIKDSLRPPIALRHQRVRDHEDQDRSTTAIRRINRISADRRHRGSMPATEHDTDLAT